MSRTTVDVSRATALMKRCPSFERCSAPRCPLDPKYDRRVKCSGDETCRSLKSTRLRIVERALAEGGVAAEVARALPFGGLTGRERQGVIAGERMRKRWEALSPEEQEAERERLRKQLASARQKAPA